MEKQRRVSMTIGDHIIRLDSVESTNEYLKKNRQKLSNGTVVFAKEQTSGRGRYDKKWLSLPDKSLTFSFLISQSNKEISIPFFHLFPAVAMVQCLNKFNVDAKIKWPNDIYLKGKKVGGLLVQTFSRAGNIDVIIGLGLNVLEDADDFPVELRDHAGSIWSLAGTRLDIEEMIQSILEQLNSIYKEFHHPSEWCALQKLWCDQCAHLKKKITIFQKDKKVDGVFIGLDKNGFAIVETHSEKIVIKDYEYVSLRAEHDTCN